METQTPPLESAKKKKLFINESINREVKTSPIYECRCDERLKTKVGESTRLAYTGFRGELEHLKIETTLINESFLSVMGACVIFIFLFFYFLFLL